MSAPSVVRIATPGDEPEVMRLCHLLHGENAIFPYSDPCVRSIVEPALARQHGMAGVIDGGDHLEGVICLQPDRMWYSEAGWFINEIFNFVDPAHRKSGHAKALIGFAKEQSAALGIPLMIGVISNERTEAKVKFYERQLGRPAGSFFLVNGTTTSFQGAPSVHPV